MPRMRYDAFGCGEGGRVKRLRRLMFRFATGRSMLTCMSSAAFLIHGQIYLTDCYFNFAGQEVRVMTAQGEVIAEVMTEPFPKEHRAFMWPHTWRQPLVPVTQPAGG